MNNKIALVTGGSRGLGKNMALSLAGKGIDVILTYNSKEEEAVAVVKEIEGKGRRAATLQLNVGEAKFFDDFTSEFRRSKGKSGERDTFDFSSTMRVWKPTERCRHERGDFRSAL